MAIRISGVTLPEDKRLVIALTSIYGIGPSLSSDILTHLGLSEDLAAKDLTSDEVNKLREYLENTYKIEGELRREVAMNIKHLKDTGTYRGVRHMKKLPVRGQKTRTNTRTVRGNVRRTAGSGRRSAAEKT